MTDTALYQSLRDIKLTTVRRAISSGCYRRSALQTFGWFAFDLALYLGALWGVFGSESAWVKLAFGRAAQSGLNWASPDRDQGWAKREPLNAWSVSCLTGNIYLKPRLVNGIPGF